MNATILSDIKERHNLNKDDEISILPIANTKSVIDREQRLIRAIATSSAVDLSDEVVVQDGCDWSYLLKNRKILIDHKNSMECVVGTLVNQKANTKIINNKLVTQSWQILVHILPLTQNKIGDDILTIAEHSGIGMSIGFQVLEKGSPTKEEMQMYNDGKPFSSIIRKCKLLEVSFVAMPCNPEAQSMDIKALANAKKIKSETLEIFGMKEGIKKEPLKVSNRKIIII